ncbi:MAG TPA: DinB family protein [Bryobacteraceae bacterium]|jgi:uncharacterized damage-inducible protein DinB|nr:DinB family protein [Bryobacteraceae bacterium]
MTEFSVNESIAILARTPAALSALLSGLPAGWTQTNEGENTWSAFDIMGHLVFVDRTDWMPRLRIILESGESRPFEPLDRFAHLSGNEGKSPEQLLQEFAEVRSANLDALNALDLQPQHLTLRGTHPALGTVTLAELLAAWVVHDLTHIHQLSRVLAGRYRDAVGPWRAYLGVLQCQGHSG